MKKLYIFLSVIMVGGIVLSSGFQNEQKSGKDEWGNLRNLGSNINSPGKDEHVTFTPDGRTMIFASIREGGKGHYDLYMSTYKKGEWTEAELLPGPVNTEKNEFDPFITPDGKMLLFATNRENSDKFSDCDIYVSEWDENQWGQPRIFDPVFVTPDKPDWSPTITLDFRTIIFASAREPAKADQTLIFKSKWLGDKWSRPEALPEPINTGYLEGTPYITPDGATLYTCSNRGEEGKKDVDIWKFEYCNGKWTNAQRMTGPFLSEKYDYDPRISPDGTKFYFTSNREGGMGDSDIWVVERISTK